MRVVTTGRTRRPPPVTIHVSPVFDFVTSLTIAGAADSDGYEATAAWRELVRQRDQQPLLERLTRLLSVGTDAPATDSLAILAVDGPPSVIPFLTMLEEMPADRLALLILKHGDIESDAKALPVESLLAAVAGDKAAIAQLLANLSGERRRQVTLWLADPIGMQIELVSLLRDWYHTIFQPEEGRLLAIVRRDAEVKERLLTSQGATDLLRAVGGTIELTFTTNSHRIILAPSLLARPAIFLADDDTATTGLWLIIYPVADESLEEPEALAPPRRLVRLYKALADETRLKILRLLVNEELYLTEIAERLGLSKPTVSHHMVQLRAADLVEVRNERKNEIYYRLHRAGLSEPSRQLGQYLGQ